MWSGDFDGKENLSGVKYMSFLVCRLLGTIDAFNLSLLELGSLGFLDRRKKNFSEFG